MRYLPIGTSKEGMALARPIYGGNLEVLLAKGSTLSSGRIQKLAAMGYAGVYIEDTASQEAVAQDVVPDKVRLGTIRAAQDMWEHAETGGAAKDSARSARQRQERIVMPVIDALISNRRRLVELIDLKPEGEYLYYHAANVVILSLLIGVELGLPGERLYELGMSALLHDLGNIFIPKDILVKPTRLTPSEIELVRTHTERGFQYLRENFNISIEGCMGALQHHENYDGSGYPTGLKRDKISIYGRIIAITDVYDAMTSRRPFRGMLYPPQVMDYMNQNAGILFDPEILAAFERVTPLYPTGFLVELDTGEQGVVVRNYPGDPGRPCVRSLSEGEEYMDLHADPRYKRTSVRCIVGI